VVGDDGDAATDEDSMAKAMRRKATVNLGSPSKEKSSKSFLSFSTPHISDNLSSVCVSLGNSIYDIIVSAKALRHMKFDQLNIAPKALSKPDTTLIDE
jgi:hypothetical protein